jgi:cysteine desulfurase/selenocysteine lyase
MVDDKRRGGDIIVSTQLSKADVHYDIAKIRTDFPILSQEIYGKPLVYLDNGASSQKPRQVIAKIVETYETQYANVHRGVHFMSQKATDEMELAREKVRQFINAKSEQEVIFVRGATEGINLVASSWGKSNLTTGDEIILSQMEHHSNIVPWQLIAKETGAVIKVAPINDQGDLIYENFESLVNEKTRLVAITHVSNALGTIVDLNNIIRTSHEAGALVLVDGCQAAPHLKIDVQALDSDFYVFSGHKIYGPSGIGILHGKEYLLDSMPPYQGGGEMIDSVTFENSTWADLPFKFEAGTPNIAGSIGLGAAIDYVSEIGLDSIGHHEGTLLEYATESLQAIKSIRIIGESDEKAAILSFTMGEVHPHDIGTILDREGVAVRTGHHCAQPLMDRFGVPATVRASFGLYNTIDEVDALTSSLMRVQEIFR